MGEAAGRERPPWRCTVAVQAALCLALYAAFSLGEPQLIPRGGGAGGVRRRRLPQRRWRRAGTHRAGQAPEAGARVCTHPLSLRDLFCLTRTFRRLVPPVPGGSGVLHLVPSVCDFALSLFPLLRDVRHFLRGPLVDLTSSPRLHFALSTFMWLQLQLTHAWHRARH